MPTRDAPFKPSIAIVGAGIGGLALAHKLLNDERRWKDAHITLYERKPRFGGRIKTVRTKDGWYEAGASRVGDTHRRVRQFAKAVGCIEVPLDVTYDQRHTLPPVYTDFKSIYKQFIASHGKDALSSLTWHDILTLECKSFTKRDELERQWGFRSILTEMNAADFWNHAMPQYLCKNYFTFEGGLQTMVDKAVAALQSTTWKSRITVESSVRVLKIDNYIQRGRKKVRITIEPDVDYMALEVQGVPINMHAHRHTKVYDAVFLALPAEALAELQGEPTKFAHFWSSVSRNHLIRCYARYDTVVTHKKKRGAGTRKSKIPRISKLGTKTKTPSLTKKKKSYTRTRSNSHRTDADLCKSSIKTTALCRCTSTHSKEWKQIAYCDHEHADHLFNIIRMPNGLNVLRNITKRTLGDAWAEFGEHDTDIYFWKRGTHSWKPKLTSADHYSRVLQPDAKSPWFVIGASFSHYQHWMEGAFETAYDAYAKFCRYANEWWGVNQRKRNVSKYNTKSNTTVYLHKACAQPTKQWTMKEVQKQRFVVLDGYVYDVSSMVARHPGGAALLERMRGRDISEMYHRIGHSSTARAWVEEGCVGVFEKN